MCWMCMWWGGGEHIRVEGRAWYQVSFASSLPTSWNWVSHWTWNSSIELYYLGSWTLKFSCLRLPIVGSHLSTTHSCYMWVLRIWTRVPMFTQQVLYLAIEPSARWHSVPSVSHSLLRLLERLRERNLTTNIKAKHNLMELRWCQLSK